MATGSLGKAMLCCEIPPRIGITEEEGIKNEIYTATERYSETSQKQHKTPSIFTSYIVNIKTQHLFIVPYSNKDIYSSSGHYYSHVLMTY